MCLQCGSSDAAKRRHGDLHWQHKGPGLQQQGSTFHPALLSAYPSTTLLFILWFPARGREVCLSLNFIFNRTLLCAVKPLICPSGFPSLCSPDILLNRSQQLFASCTAKFADGQQCSIPVFDITHQTPLCDEHAKKMVGKIMEIKLL